MSGFAKDQIEKWYRIHLEPEFACDIARTMESVAEDPFYEMHPMGLSIRGRDAVRTFYERLLPGYMGSSRRPVLRAEAYTDTGIMTEFSMLIRQPDESWLPAWRMNIIEFDAGGNVTSERSYASPAMDELVVRLLGPDIWELPGFSKMEYDAATPNWRP